SDVTLAWSGVSYQEATASGGGSTYLLALIFVFLALAALYNSWSLPVSILLGVPLALFGSLLIVWLAHLGNPIFIDNIYMKVSLVMLIGLSAKSAILVVEYADRKFFDEGLSLGEASLAAAKLRLRPILMTAIAFIVGIMPLVFASGAYSVARNVMGVALVGGMAVATALGIFIYPSLYYLMGRITQFEKRRERIHKKRLEYEKENSL
ncbi:MAG: efflux RND transporter permease subunit, partial [Tidjanibacter sp.]|nr:efflux RND transporter permease subunit [Tidjanibacter sp.]